MCEPGKDDMTEYNLQPGQILLDDDIPGVSCRGLANDNVEYCSYFLRESAPRISWWCDGPDEKRLDLELFEELVIQFMLDWLA